MKITTNCPIVDYIKACDKPDCKDCPIYKSLDKLNKINKKGGGINIEYE